MASPSSPGQVGRDLLPTVQLLSKLVDPHIKTLVFLSLLYNPLRVVPGLPGLVPVSPSGLPVPALLGAAALLLGAFAKPVAADDVEAESGGPAGPWPWFKLAPDESLQALLASYKNVGAYLKVGFLVYLGSSLFRQHDVSVPFFLVPPRALAAILVTGAAVVIAFASTPRLYGPFRFCYREHAAHVAYLYGLLLDGWQYAALLLLSPSLAPPVAFGGAWAAVAAVAYVCRAYHAQRRVVADEVAGYVSEANLAVAAAREHAAAVRGYEERLLGTVLLTGPDGAWEKPSARGVRSAQGQAAAMAKLLGDETRGASASADQVFAATKGADEVARLAAKARAAAERGEGKEARELVAAAREGAERVVESMEEVHRALGRTRATLLAWLGGRDG